MLRVHSRTKEGPALTSRFACEYNYNHQCLIDGIIGPALQSHLSYLHLFACLSAYLQRTKYTTGIRVSFEHSRVTDISPEIHCAMKETEYIIRRPRYVIKAHICIACRRNLYFSKEDFCYLCFLLYQVFL